MADDWSKAKVSNPGNGQTLRLLWRHSEPAEVPRQQHTTEGLVDESGREKIAAHRKQTLDAEREWAKSFAVWDKLKCELIAAMESERKAAAETAELYKEYQECRVEIENVYCTMAKVASECSVEKPHRDRGDTPLGEHGYDTLLETFE